MPIVGLRVCHTDMKGKERTSRESKSVVLERYQIKYPFCGIFQGGQLNVTEWGPGGPCHAVYTMPVPVDYTEKVCGDRRCKTWCVSQSSVLGVADGHYVLLQSSFYLSFVPSYTEAILSYS